MDPSGETPETVAEKLKKIAQEWIDSVSSVIDNAKDSIIQTMDDLQNYLSAIDMAKFLSGAGKVAGGAVITTASCAVPYALCVPAITAGTLLTVPAGGSGGVAVGVACAGMASAACYAGTQVAMPLMSSGVSDIMQSKQSGQGGGNSSSPKPSSNFKTPTNSPQLPPKTVPEGMKVRVMKPTQQYPNGYWRIEKPMPQGGMQGIDPSTMKPGSQSETHIPLPQGYWQ